MIQEIESISESMPAKSGKTADSQLEPPSEITVSREGLKTLDLHGMPQAVAEKAWDKTYAVTAKAFDLVASRNLVIEKQGSDMIVIKDGTVKVRTTSLKTLFDEQAFQEFWLHLDGDIMAAVANNLQKAAARQAVEDRINARIAQAEAAKTAAQTP